MGKYKSHGRECERLFCEGNTLDAIFKITGVSLRSLSIWKNKYGWDRKRLEYQQLPVAIHKKIVKIFSSFLDDLIQNGIQSNKHADSVAKLAKAMNTTGGIEDLPGMVYTVMTDFITFLEKTCQDEEFTEKFYVYMQEYFQWVKERAYGSD